MSPTTGFAHQIQAQRKPLKAHTPFLLEVAMLSLLLSATVKVAL